MSTERGIETSGRLRPTTHRTRIVAIALLTTVAAALGLLISNPISANGATPISVSARGDAGGEKVELIADGKVIDTFTLDKSVNTFSATVNERPTNVRVRFINDRRSNGVDLNAVVERITVDGVDHSPTDTSVLSTGTYTQGLGCARGSARSNRLHCNGYFEFRIGEAAEAEPASGLRRIEVRAKGQTGEERIELRVGNDVLADWKLATSTKSFVHDTSASVGGKNVEVHFVNDAKSSAGDRNAQIDFVAIDGNKIEAEDPSVYSTGTYGRSTGCDGGNKRSEFLHCSGYFRFSIPAEEAGSAAIEHEQAVAAAAIAPAPEPEKAVDVSPEQSTDPDQKPAPEEQVAPSC